MAGETLNAIEQDIYRRLGFNTSSVDTATQTRIRAFINETQNEILSEPGMESLLYDTITFASVASTPTYALPQAVARIRDIYDTANRFVLLPGSLDWYRQAYPAPTLVTGLSDRWVDLGMTAVAKQPSAAAQLFVKSTSAGDTQSVFIEGYRTGGYFTSETITANGVTAVGSATTDYIEVTKFYLSSVAVGTVTLLEASGVGTELARIAIGRTHARYRTIALAICPSSAVTYTVDYERDVQDMANANDEPVLPPRFHRILGIGARMREYEKQQQMDRYRAAQGEYLYALKKLKMFVYSQSVGTPNLRANAQPRRGSRLGAWLGEDRW